MYKSEDCGIFIGLTTMPLGKGQTFYKDEIQQGIFENYKKRLSRYFKKKIDSQEEQRAFEAFEAYMYRPKAYCILGNYDLAVLSLIDEFSISSRVFHPYSTLLIDSETSAQSQNFTYQTITGTVPELTFLDKKKKKSPNLIEKSKATFLARQAAPIAPESVFPFIGICSIKINNALLIGGGAKLLHLIMRMVKEQIEQEESYRAGDMDFILLNSFAWNELTIVFFSNSFKKISDKILEIRELVLGDLKPYDDKDCYEHIVQNCLIDKLKKAEKIECEDLEEVSLFVNTITIFGYDAELMENSDYIEKPPTHFKKFNVEELRFYTRWYIKPGHLEQSMEVLSAVNSANITIGRGDYVQILEKDSFKKMAAYIQQLSNDEKHPLLEHIQKVYSIPQLTYDKEKITAKQTKHSPNIADNLGRNFIFTLEEINAIKKQLKQYRISKILRDKVINMYINYNDGMHDETLYGYFIDLRSYLQRVQRDIAFYGKDESGKYNLVATISKELQKFCNNFEKAHRNRFHLSHIMNEITDYNLEFSGGIQQIVGAFDGAYKSISTILGSNKHRLPFVYITGYSGVTSNLYSAKLNSYHLFQPEFFVAVATHEAANNILDNSAEDTKEVQILRTYVKEDGILDRLYPKAVGYFLVDIITFYLAYNKNVKLFNYWHWGNFLQTALYYNKDGSVNRDMFKELLLRILLLFKFLEEEETLNATQAPCKILEPYWAVDFKKMSIMAEQLLEQEDLFEWFDCSEVLANKVVIDDFTGISENRDTVNNKMSRPKRAAEIIAMMQEPLFEQNQVRDKESYLRAYRAKVDQEVMVLLGRFEEMEFISKAMVDSFKKNEVYIPKPFNVINSSSFYIQSLFYAYLKLLYEMNNGEIIVMERDEAGQPIMESLYVNRLMFDSTGGMFVRNYALRRQYFRYRTLLFQAIWGIGCEYRKRLFE